MAPPSASKTVKASTSSRTQKPKPTEPKETTSGQSQTPIRKRARKLKAYSKKQDKKVLTFEKTMKDDKKLAAATLRPAPNSKTENTTDSKPPEETNAYLESHDTHIKTEPPDSELDEAIAMAMGSIPVDDESPTKSQMQRELDGMTGEERERWEVFNRADVMGGDIGEFADCVVLWCGLLTGVHDMWPWGW